MEQQEISRDEKLLVKMFEKATNLESEQIDLLSVKTFCHLIYKDYRLVKKALNLILETVKSDCPVKSLRSLEVLGECFENCGNKFQEEASKFRALNHLIELVSVKHKSKTTPSEIKNKIMDYLLLWTTKYPERKNIKSAYDMLSKQGIEHTISSNVPIPTDRKCTFVDDGVSEQLGKLIKSTNPEDHKRANLLIQHYVEQDEKRSQLLIQQKKEMKEAESTMEVLNEMIDTYENEKSVNEEESLNMMNYLYSLCKKFLPRIQRMLEVINFEEDIVEETLHLKDELDKVIARYKSIIRGSTLNSQDTISTGTVKSDEEENLIPNLEENAPVVPTVFEDRRNRLDCLDDFFFDPISNELTSKDVNVLEPIPVYQDNKIKEDAEVEVEVTDSSPESESNPAKYGFLSFVDKASEEAFKELKGDEVRIGAFKKNIEKTSLNAMKTKNKKCATSAKKPQNNNLKVDAGRNKSTDQLPTDSEKSVEKSNLPDLTLFDLEEALKNIKKDIPNPLLSTSLDDLMIGQEDDPVLRPEGSYASDEDVDNDTIKLESKNDHARLANIVLDLSSIVLSNEGPKKILDDIKGLRVILRFASNRPSNNVIVIVITVDNQGQVPITHFRFVAAVDKPCRVRLLEPTDSTLQEADAFGSPTKNIRQIMLLYNPTEQPVDITCILIYNLFNDPDPITETVVAKNVPFFIS